MKRKLPETLEPQVRTLSLRLLPGGDGKRGVQIDKDTRTCQLAFSSDAPVEMWYGTEILSHAPGAMRQGLRQQTMPLLFNHCMDDLLGVVESIDTGTDGINRATVRFGKDERGSWAMGQASDDILVNVSFAYRVYKWLDDTEADTLTAVDWEPLEISLVTVPADPTVGVGRNASPDVANGVQVIRSAAESPAPLAQTFSPSVSQPLEQSMKFRHFRLQEQVTGEATASGTGQSTPAAGTSLQATTVSNGDASRGVDPAAQQRGAEAERARMTEIDALARKYNLSAELRTGLIQRGATIEQARLTAADVVLERAQKSGKPVADFGDTNNPDLTQKEKARYSMIRAVNAALTGKWDGAGFELECSNEIAKRTGRTPSESMSFFVPTNLRAAYSVGTAGAGTTGGTMVATNLLAGSFIEVLRNKARVMQLGATVLSGLVGNVDIPRQTGQTATFWTAEGVDTSESEATFDKVSLSLKTIGTYSLITRNMLMQATPDIDMIARADMLAAMALGIDLAALSGSGSGAIPRGIANVSGVGSVIGGTNGAAVSLDNYIDLETQVTAANAPETNLAYLTNAKTIGSTKKLKSTTGQYLWTGSSVGAQSGTPGEINGYSVARSNQARSNLTKGTSTGVCSEIFFGAWSELLVGEWGVLEIVPNPYDAAAYKSGGVLLRALQSIDIGVRHAASFSVMSDALTP
jgi:HK97 family phage major capsid protein/HK97 family phage prohead protease